MPLVLEGYTSDSLESKHKKTEESYMKTHKEQTGQIEELTEEICSLKESNTKAEEYFRKTIKDHGDTIGKQTKKIGSLKESNKEKKEKLMRTKKEQNDTVKKLTKEIDSLRESNKETEKSLMRIKKEQSDTVEKLIKETESLMESNKKTEEKFMTTNKEQTDTIETLTREIGSLNESNKETEVSLMRITKEQSDTVEKLTKEIDSFRESNKKAEENYMKTNKEQADTIETLTREIGSLKESNKETDESLMKTKKEHSDTVEQLIKEIDSLMESNKKAEEKFMKTNKKNNEEIDRLIELNANDNRTWQQRFNKKENENAELSDKISTLTEEKQDLEAEKQDAMRRLRDNNPCIVNLNDQCRPTKLAEMLSELHDNEWTNAFDVLEGPFSEEQAIVVLLDTIMIAYGFCEEKVEKPWQTLKDWFLDEDLPGFQQTSKWLKDSRKANIKRKVFTVEKDFSWEIATMCDDVKLKGLLSEDSMNAYFTKCIELCLLMVATDPPIALECPHWNTYNMQQEDDGIVSESFTDSLTMSVFTIEPVISTEEEFKTVLLMDGTDMPIVLECHHWNTYNMQEDDDIVNESVNIEPELSTEEESKNRTVSDSNVHHTDHQIEHSQKENVSAYKGIMSDLQDDGNQVQEKYDVEEKANEFQLSGQNGNQESDQKEIDPPIVLDRPHLNAYNMQQGGDDQNEFYLNENVSACEQTFSKERHLFDKELFKEYTRRGTYLDYIVWPAMLLHKNGPLLSKGIAQGIKKRYREPDEVVWTWRKLKRT